MADSGDCEKKARELRELFKGRFNQQEMLKVLKLYDNDSMKALAFLMKGDATDVIKYLRKGKSLQALRNESQHLNEMLQKGSLYVGWTARMFACQDCDQKWWRRVPPRKEVSICRTCETRYEAVPKEKEWGLGLFYCEGTYCQIEFKGFAVMGRTKGMCNSCGYYVDVDHIIPPKKISKSKLLRKQRGQDGSTKIDPQACRPRPKFVHEDVDYRTWSKVHATSESTVTTFLSQGSLLDEPTDSW